MVDKDPIDAAADDVKRNARRALELVLERGREWLSVKLAFIMMAGLAGMAAAAISLSVVAALLCGVVTGLAVVFAIYARRLLYRERTARHQAAIAVLRARQLGLRHEAACLEATLALAGGPPERGVNLPSRGHPDLLAAIRFAQRRRQWQPRLQEPGQARQNPRASASPKQPDVAVSGRRLASLDAELKALESEIQCLAHPSKDREAEVGLSREEWRRIRDADREARKRGRRGQRPWPTTPETRFRVGWKPDGMPDARRLPSQPTPEQIARGERPNDGRQAA